MTGKTLQLLGVFETTWYGIPCHLVPCGWDSGATAGTFHGQDRAQRSAPLSKSKWRNSLLSPLERAKLQFDAFFILLCCCSIQRYRRSVPQSRFLAAGLTRCVSGEQTWASLAPSLFFKLFQRYVCVRNGNKPINPTRYCDIVHILCTHRHLAQPAAPIRAALFASMTWLQGSECAAAWGLALIWQAGERKQNTNTKN